MRNAMLESPPAVKGLCRKGCQQLNEILIFIWLNTRLSNKGV